MNATSAAISVVLLAGALACGGDGYSPAAPQQQSRQVPLAVTLLTPNWGPRSGGTIVTMSGYGFLMGVAVTFDGIAATDVRVLNDVTLTAIAPAHATGVAEVVVTNSFGRKSSLRFSYTDSSFNPCYGCWDYQTIPLHP